MEWIADPAAWLGLLTLIVLELVLGIDNLVFIAILADKLPPHLRDRARLIGLSLALLMRLGLLAGISWMVTLTRPLVTIWDHTFSGRDLIMLFGGIFLLFKASMELHERLEGHVVQRGGGVGYALFWPIVLQIVVLDAVFSLDAVITAVGMVEELSIMMIAVVVSIGVMIIASKPLTRFVNRHPTVIMLCLGFLMMIGFTLTAEGLGFHIPKGYLYAAIGFSLLIELLNQLARARRKKALRGRDTIRARTTHAVMRLLGGKSLDQHEVAEEVTDLVGDAPQAPIFNRHERVMISGVLQLADRSVSAIMTPAAEVDLLDIRAAPALLEQALTNSSHSRLPIVDGKRFGEARQFIHKKDVLKAILAGAGLQATHLRHDALRLAGSTTVLNALEQMRAGATHIAFVVNEYDGFIGLVTVADILQAIAGELPDTGRQDMAKVRQPR